MGNRRQPTSGTGQSALQSADAIPHLAARRTTSAHTHRGSASPSLGVASTSFQPQRHAQFDQSESYRPSCPILLWIAGTTASPSAISSVHTPALLPIFLPRSAGTQRQMPPPAPPAILLRLMDSTPPDILFLPVSLLFDIRSHLVYTGFHDVHPGRISHPSRVLSQRYDVQFYLSTL